MSADHNLRRPARLLVVIGTLDSGGTERHLLNILPLLDRDLVQTEIFTLGWRGELADAFDARGIPVIEPWISGSRKIRPVPFRLARLTLVAIQLLLRCLFRRPTIVHFFLPASYVLGGVVATIAMVRHRVMSRRSLNVYQAQMPCLGLIERWLHRHMRALVGNSAQVVAQLVGEGADPDKVSLIYNGVLPQPGLSRQERSQVRQLLSINDDAIVFSIVANLIPYKGHTDLLTAINVVQDLLPDGWRLLLIGRDDGMGERLKALVEEFRLQENVKFLGSRDDVAALLAASDIGILCSHEEGFSNAILEGMAAGLAMIVTNVGGNAEAVADGENGLVVPAGDVAALGKAIVELAGAPERRAAMGQAGRRRAEQLFSMEACVARYNRFYREILCDTE